MSSRNLGKVWLVLGVIGPCALRLGYALAERASNPFFGQPGLDAGYYLEWGRGLANGEPGPAGAYYLAPLYAFALAGLFAVMGEALLTITLVQQGVGLATAVLLGAVAGRFAGRAAGWWTFFFAALYQPLVFFASRLMSETLALLLLALALWFAVGQRSLAAGVASGFAALARPSFLPLPFLWAAEALILRRTRMGALVLAGAAAVVLPVTVRNLAASGHPVLVSSNGGVTLYHGNGPGPLGVFNPPDGFSGSLATQREEATALAGIRSGSRLDEVQADRWWGRQALRERQADPGGSLALLAKRLLLTLDSYEHGLDEAPAMDRNPWRPTARVPGRATAGRGELPLIPFGAIVGLAAAGIALRGFRGTGGPIVWMTVVTCAATPLIFYVSSRYRLPLAAALTIPAGVGAATLTGTAAASAPWRRVFAGILAAAIGAGSLVMPFDDLRAAEEAGWLANQAGAWKDRGDLRRAEEAASAAVQRDGRLAPVRYVYGLVLAAEGRESEAEVEYRAALAIDPGHAESAANLAALLAKTGRQPEAIPHLRRALMLRPFDVSCWTNLVVAYAAAGDEGSARAAAEEARQAGVRLDPGLLRTIGSVGAGQAR